jgi:Flp pilus assembly pilin Flp
MASIRSMAGPWWSRLREAVRSLPDLTRRFTRSGALSEAGQGLAEYALILSFIAIVAIAALGFFGVQLSSVLTDPVGRDISSVADLIGP